jgi:sec-independent protein translocase protein TatA
MGMTSIWHWLIVLLVVVLLFGAGRISTVMGDLGKGIKSFKKGLNENDQDDAAPAAEPRPQQRITDERPVEQRAAAPAPQPTTDLDKH